MKLIKQMMGNKFKNLLLPAAEDVLPAGSHHRRYEDDDDILKRKLKNMKR